MTATTTAVRRPRAVLPRGRRGLLAALALVAALLVLASSDGPIAHRATPLLVAIAVASLLALASLALRGVPPRNALPWALGLYVWAAAPDLLLRATGIPHAGWMDLFLGHVSATGLRDGGASWLAVALAFSGAYAWVLSRWRRARRLEVAAGMAPGVGLGGDALLRPQRSPAEETLAYQEPSGGGKPDVLLLHGLGASRRIWGPVRGRLEAGGTATLVPDLLGFGASRSIGTTFDLDAHVAALLRLLDAARAPRLVVAGHSFGCAGAVALARRAPGRVAALVLVAPPVFRDGAQAREHLARRDWLSRQVVRGSPVAGLCCALMCLLRRPAATLVARVARHVPVAIARDSVQHSWPAYRDALDALLDDNPLPAWIAAPARPTTVVLGDADFEAPAGDVLDSAHDAVDVVLLDGDHLILLERPGAVAELIAATTGSRSDALSEPVRGRGPP